VGKTTLALQFLLDGLRRGEKCLYVTLSETRQELDVVAQSHGWTLEGMNIIELSQVETSLTSKSQNTLFQPAEVELNNLSQLLMDEFQRIRPVRMVLDSLSEMRLLAQNPLRYRRQVLRFKQVCSEGKCTVLVLDDQTGGESDVQVHSIVHGALTLEMAQIKFGVYRRYLKVTKLRGSTFREGNHDYVIHRGGLKCFPRLVAAEHGAAFDHKLSGSGNSELDLLLGGGFHAGTSNLIMGPAGSGKSTIASMFAHAAVETGMKVSYYAFDENLHTLKRRAGEMNIPFEPAVESGLLELTQINPAQIAPGELASRIVHAVTNHGARMVVLDSLNGYVNSMPQDDFLHLHLHELLSFLNQHGVVTIMILAQHGLIGPMGAPVDVSYLADTVVLMRFFEARGAVKKAISIIKKRSGPHEQAIREMRMTPGGVIVGEPLDNFEGVLTGVPRFVGTGAPLNGR
jgi:circadian clock protein KaiC